MNKLLFYLLLLLIAVRLEAKRVEVKGSKDRPLDRHFTKPKAQAGKETAPKRPPADPKQGLDSKGPEAAAWVRSSVDDIPIEPSEPKSKAIAASRGDPLPLDAGEAPGSSGSPVPAPPAKKEGGSFFSSIVGSLFSVDKGGSRESGKPATKLSESVVSKGGEAISGGPPSGSDQADGRGAAVGATAVSASGDAVPVKAPLKPEEVAPKVGSTSDPTPDLERRRQMQLHKQKLEMQELEAQKMREIEEEIQRKKEALEADMKARELEAEMKLLASQELEAKRLKEVEVEMAKMRAQAETELAEKMSEQKKKLEEIEQIEWQKLRELDDEVEKKRIATEAFMNQSMKFKEMELALNKRESDLNLAEVQLQIEAEERRKAIDELVAQRLKDYEVELDIRRAAADKLIKSQEGEWQQRLTEIDGLAQERLREANANADRILAEAEAVVQAQHLEADTLLREAKEYEAIALREIEAKMQATRRINETLIKEIETEAKKKAKETERIESQRRMEFEDEIERRRLVIDDLIQQVELEAENKRKVAASEVEMTRRNFEYEIERRRAEMEHDIAEFNVTMERKKANLTDFEAKKIREVDEEIQRRRISAEALLREIEAEAEEKRRVSLKEEEARLSAFENELKRRRQAAEALVLDLERQVEEKREVLGGIEELGLLELENEAEKRKAAIEDLVRSVEREAEAKRKMAEELQYENLREFEFDLQRRKAAADAELADLQRKAEDIRKSLDDMQSQRLRDIENEILRIRAQAEEELQATKDEAVAIKHDTESFRASKLREIDNEILQQQNVFSELKENLEREYAEMGKKLERNHSLRVIKFENEFDQKRLEAEKYMKNAEATRQRRQTEFQATIEREVAVASGQLRELDREMESRRQNILQLEETSNKLVAEKLAILEATLSQRRKEAEDELEEHRSNAFNILQTARVEADALLSRSIQDVTAEVESHALKSLEVERDRVLGRMLEFEKLLINETRRSRDLEFENDQLESKQLSLEHEIATLKQLRADAEADKSKCATRYKELQESMADNLKQIINLEDDYQSLFLQLRNCEIEGYADNSQNSCAESKQRLKVSEEKTNRLESERKVSDLRCEEVKRSDARRIAELEADLRNSLFNSKVDNVNQDCQFIDIERSKNEQLSSELVECNARADKYENYYAANEAKIHELELELRRLSEVKHSCEMEKTAVKASRTAQDAELIRDLEFGKSQAEAKLKEQERALELEARRYKELGKDFSRCQEKVSSVQDTSDSYYARIGKMEDHIRQLIQANEDCGIESIPHFDASQYELSFLGKVLKSSRDFFLSLDEGFSSKQLLSYCFFGILGVFITWKVFFKLLFGHDSTVESARASPFERYNARLPSSANNGNVSSSQNRIFGQLHSSSGGVLDKTRSMSTPSNVSSETQSALVGRIKRIVQQEDERR